MNQGLVDDLFFEDRREQEISPTAKAHFKESSGRFYPYELAVKEMADRVREEIKEAQARGEEIIW